MWYLKLKHWQVFCFLIPAVIMQIFTWESNELVTQIINTTGYIIFFILPLFMGEALHNIANMRFDLNHNFFLINASIVLLSFTIPAIVGSFHFTGLAALPFLYIFFAFLYSFAYPVKAMNTIEKGKDVSFSQYAGDFFLLLFFPIGIWIIQPRLNKIASLHTSL